MGVEREIIVYGDRPGESYLISFLIRRKLLTAKYLSGSDFLLSWAGEEMFNLVKEEYHDKDYDKRREKSFLIESAFSEVSDVHHL